MGRVISFEDQALANLRARVAAAEEANQDLIAFARGHSGAVASIHEAVLAAIEAEGLDHLHPHRHPGMAADPRPRRGRGRALFAGDMGVRADASGLQFVDPRLIERSIGEFDGVLLRGVERGHPLFGPACELIRAEALIRLTSEPPLPSGAARAGPARRPELRHPPRLGAAHLPRPGADPLHGPVADPLDADLAPAHPARLIAARWHDHLTRERRRSEHTVRAYVATAHRLIAFLAGHLGGAGRRAGAARRCSRRTCAPSSPCAAPTGSATASAARELSAVRGFLAFAAPKRGARRALPRLKGPKKPRSVPRPISPDEAVSLAEEAAEDASAALDRRARPGGADSCSTARACASPRRSA